MKKNSFNMALTLALGALIMTPMTAKDTDKIRNDIGSLDAEAVSIH